MQRSNTTVVRVLESARNEKMVLAESTLQGERAVALIRLALAGAIVLSQGAAWLSKGAREPLDLVAYGLVAAYALFGGAVMVLLRRMKLDPERARITPLILSVADFVFLAAIAARFDGVDGHPTPEIAAIAMAVALSFSVARWGAVHIGLSVLLAVSAFTAVAARHGVYRFKPYFFVIAGFVTLGLLLWRTNVQVRRMFLNLRRRENLSRFLPRPLVEHVLAYGDELAPSNRTVTLLFLDIRSFTSFSENLPPRAVLEFLDEFLGEMSRIVMGHDGTVNKFLGDGLMAFWGAPTRQEDHAVRAVRAALDIRRRLAELNRERVTKGLKPVAVGVGLHTGSVAAGMLGGAEQHEYTVIGDTVNVASRLESLTKTLGTDVLLSEDTVSCLGGRFDCERLAEEHVKGRTAPVVVHGLRGAAPRP